MLTFRVLIFASSRVTGEVESSHSSREKIRKAGLISERHKTMTTSSPVPRSEPEQDLELDLALRAGL